MVGGKLVDELDSYSKHLTTGFFVALDSCKARRAGGGTPGSHAVWANCYEERFSRSWREPLTLHFVSCILLQVTWSDMPSLWSSLLSLCSKASTHEGGHTVLDPPSANTTHPNLPRGHSSSPANTSHPETPNRDDLRDAALRRMEAVRFSQSWKALSFIFFQSKNKGYSTDKELAKRLNDKRKLGASLQEPSKIVVGNASSIMSPI